MKTSEAIVVVLLLLGVLGFGFILGATFGQDCVVVCRAAPAARDTSDL